jgi:DNA-binding transcriptional MerR regulator
MAHQRTPKYSLDDLAALGGISTRTLRYYLSEGLLPPPLGRGPGKHYDDAHLTRLQSLQYHQGLGMDLTAIKSHFESHYATAALNRGEFPPELGFDAELVEREPTGIPLPNLSPWSRITLAPGLELHVSGEHRMPPAQGIAHITAVCRLILGISEEDDRGPD